MVAFCVSCSDNALYHNQLHQINHVPLHKRTQQKDTLLKAQNNLKKEQKKLQTNIDSFVFE
jgi:hypothetical protein